MKYEHVFLSALSVPSTEPTGSHTGVVHLDKEEDGVLDDVGLLVGVPEMVVDGVDVPVGVPVPVELSVLEGVLDAVGVPDGVSEGVGDAVILGVSEDVKLAPIPTGIALEYPSLLQP